MTRNSLARGKRLCLCAARSVVLLLAVLAGGRIAPASAQQPNAAAGAVAALPPLFTVIVTRHGVRSISNTPENYEWPSWEPVKESFLTEHGYQLMTLMGDFYRNDPQGAFYRDAPGALRAECKNHGVFVYADKDQRTLLTAQALVKGLCPDDALPIFHEKDLSASDPIFNGAAWLAERRRVNAAASSRAVGAVAGSPPSTIVMSHAKEFSMLQRILDTRCGARCAPVARGASAIAVKNDLAGLGGPLATASSYAEDLFLEYAQCRPIGQMTNDPKFQTDLEAAMRLHVLAYDVNARDAYNPLVRGATLLAHIVGMLDQKAGRHLGNVDIPSLDGKTTLVIFSGHDTQLGALGGILDAHWKPEGGIVPDDMPPGSALIFDLIGAPDDKYNVRVRFAAMTLEQFRATTRIKGDGGVKTTDVTFTGCANAPCALPLEQFESLALTLEALGFVDDAWTPDTSDAVKLDELKDPEWTNCGG